MARTRASTLAVLVLAGAAAIAQDRPAPSDSAFEVASVKPSPRDDVPEGIDTLPDGSARFTRFQVRTLITIAYRSDGIQRFDQLIGAPSWVSVHRFDIGARSPNSHQRDRCEAPRSSLFSKPNTAFEPGRPPTLRG